jgi:regulator of sigma E protease
VPLTLLAFVFVLGVLIFVHELGHFLAAKATGIGVPRFSIGFGPATPLTFRRGGTEYRIAWIPLGGYVKMASKEEQEAMAALEGGDLDEEYPADKLFENKPLGARILVISAGVIMNVVFAWLVYTGITAIYGRSEDPTTTFAGVDEEILPDAAGQLAGLPFGTQIVGINGDTMSSLNAIGDAVLDLTSDRLRIDFAGDLDPVILEIPGTDANDRIGVWSALVPLWQPKVGSVLPGKPAARAGIERDDHILRIEGDTIRSWHEMVDLIQPMCWFS